MCVHVCMHVCACVHVCVRASSQAADAIQLVAKDDTCRTYVQRWCAIPNTQTYSLSGRLHPCTKNKYYTYLHIYHAMSYNTLLYLKYRMALGIAKATDSWECLQNVSVVWSTTWYLSGDTTQMQHLLTASCHRALPGLPSMVIVDSLAIASQHIQFDRCHKALKQCTQTDTHHCHLHTTSIALAYWDPIPPCSHPYERSQCPTWLPALLSPLT